MIKYSAMAIISLVAIASSAAPPKLKPFQTDQCTFFISGVWDKCCEEHDLFYWIGGTKEQQTEVDKMFLSCLKSETNPLVANLMYLGVRLGHYSPIKHKTSWSWGRVGISPFLKVHPGILKLSELEHLSENEKNKLVQFYFNQVDQ
jgi:hypothetical protein